MILSPVKRTKGLIYVLETKKIRNAPSVTLLGALFMTYLDIIIDPVALRGDKWFLGKIHEYPGGGAYFGVPISNFMGWFLVGCILIVTLQKLDGYLSGTRDIAGYNFPWRFLVGPALYYSVLAFNLGVTFFIGEYTLAWAGMFIVLCPTVLFLYCTKMKLSGGGERQAEVSAHLSDFPAAAIPGVVR
jgi:putative membrane protein